MAMDAAEDHDELSLNAVPECVLESVKEDAPIASVHIGVQEGVFGDSGDSFIYSGAECRTEAVALKLVPVLDLLEIAFCQTAQNDGEAQ